MDPVNDPKTALRRPTRLGPWIAVAAALVAAGAWWLWRGSSAPEPPAPAPVASAPAAPAAQAPDGPAPTIEEGNVRALLEGVSKDRTFHRWLAQGDLVSRWVTLTDNLAEGVTPRAQLRFLAPREGFSAVERGGTLVASPRSYKRYDAFADVVATVDARALAGVYRTLHPVLEGAYRLLGYPGASLDAVTARALRRIENARVVEGEVALERRPHFLVYADPALERLPEVEKHLLRMGPRNTRILQAKARELDEALGLPAAVETATRR
jgi:hypothetical protein